MELGIPLHELFYAVLMLCVAFPLVAFPPQEFITAGVTIPSVFHFVVGEERSDFVQFHLRRTIVTMAVHAAMLPAMFIALHVYGSSVIFTATPGTVIQFLAHLVIALTVGIYSYLFYLCRNKYFNHPMVRNFQKFGGTVDQIIQNINADMHNIANLQMKLIGYTRLIITDSWVMKVSNYTVTAIPVAHIEVEATEAHMAPSPSLHGGPVQFVNVNFSSRLYDLSFSVRLNSVVLTDVRERLDRPIRIAEDVVLYRTTSDRFVTAFSDAVGSNPTIPITNQVTDLCLGCSSTNANVVLSKDCLDSPNQSPRCGECQCPPMWCVTCMARVFASRQDENNTESWLNMVKTVSSPEYVDWLQELQKTGGEFSWIRATKDFPRNTSDVRNPKERTINEINEGVLKSHRVQSTITQVMEQTKMSRTSVEEQAKEILLTMAHNFNMNAVRTIGYPVVKVISRLFDAVYVNMKQLTEVRNIVKSDPVVFMPTHNSYVDFLLLSLLCFDQNVTLPAIAAGADFMSSKFMGEALRRCGAFFIRRSFGKDLLYWAVFTEYVQTHLTHSDRPVEFFVEGTRSRTSKSLYPKFGLLQVLLEPYLRGDLFDIVIVPVSMSYDKILEEFLYAYELLGFPKPKETTSGLLKARQILNRKFGKIFMTFGEPISVRKYFGTALHRSAFVCQPDSQFVLSSREKQAIRIFGHKIVHIHNENRVVGVWPLACLLIQHTLDNRRKHGNMDRSIVYRELLVRLKHFVELCSKIQVPIHFEQSIEHELRYYTSLHQDVFSFTSSSNEYEEFLVLDEQRVENRNHIEKNVLQEAVSSLLVANYANLAIPHLFDVALHSSFLLHVTNEDDLASTFSDVRSLFMREFVYIPGTASAIFEQAKSRLIAAKVISLTEDNAIKIERHDLVTQLSEIAQPFITSYLYTVKVVLAIPLPPFSFPEAVKRIQIAVSSHLTSAESPLGLRSSDLNLDLIKNALNSLIDAGALFKMNEGLEISTHLLNSIAAKLHSACSCENDLIPRYHPKL